MARQTALLVLPLILAPATMTQPPGVSAHLIPSGLQTPTGSDIAGVGAHLIPDGLHTEPGG